MKKFKLFDTKEIIELYGDIEEYGIKEEEYNLYSLCAPNDKDIFTTVNVIIENGVYYVDFNEVSKWDIDNLKIGCFID